jgi:hypothetical protein
LDLAPFVADSWTGGDAERRARRAGDKKEARPRGAYLRVEGREFTWRPEERRSADLRCACAYARRELHPPAAADASPRVTPSPPRTE